MASYIQIQRPSCLDRDCFHTNREPERVEAVQWTGDNFDEVCAAFPDVDARITPKYRQLVITTHEGEIAVKAGRWVIRAVGSASTWVMFPEAFEDRYAPLNVAVPGPQGTGHHDTTANRLRLRRP